MLGDKRALAWPGLGRRANRRAINLSMTWLMVWFGGSAVVAVITGHQVIYAHGWPLIVAFLLFGPLGEELLFRGLIYERVRVLAPSAPTIAVAVSTAVFSLHHIALHAAPRGLQIAQVLFTIPMGVVFALLRERTGSIWPGLLLHLATNLPGVI